MKLALISDIHSNLEALTAALEAVERFKPDELICLGDIVGYGADPGECIELVRNHTSRVIMGNHDAAVANLLQPENNFNDYALTAIHWTRSVLSDDHRDYLKTLPLEILFDDLHLVHGTPGNPGSFDYVLTTYDAEVQFTNIKGSNCFIGHTHRPGIYMERDPVDKTQPKRIINIGSVGQPRDGDPRLCFALYETKTEEVEFIRVEYDIETAATKIRTAGLPALLAERLGRGG
ncbi:metallophosphoesterase [candidate division LCP-89 bacterium B3_LCP]|uniref:Metallophosphoesterase n=1 Tax=candidate division LCP-89 bacterium B3_LCP TaxID=2012998 RepID=A0A532V2S3_UNCL8|nr:MAG: metallophosphoesterase [candidate division LCP-89 bacterium B3_LCP]